LGPTKHATGDAWTGSIPSSPYAQEVRVPSNGTYTLGLITKDDAGITVVNSLDPTAAGRKIFDIQESAAGTAD